MRKIVTLLLAIVLAITSGIALTSCDETAEEKSPSAESTTDYTVGVCQLMKHESLDQATEGFKAALTEAIEKEGKKVEIEISVAGESSLCGTVINTFTSKNVDLIMANATPALLAAANATSEIPVLGTSVTDYKDTFGGAIPANVTGTSDAVPFDEQAKMMITTLDLKKGDVVGVLYCSNESNSLLQYEAVKALFEAEGIVVKPYTFSETTELQAVVNTAVSNCKAIYVPSDNTVAENDSIVGSICKEKNIPVYTSYASSICYASLAIDYYELGAETGRMAAEILLGKKTPADFEVKTLTPAVTYNNELCKALGIEVPEAK